jgi:mono/diheme cytochrome c family protein
MGTRWFSACVLLLGGLLCGSSVLAQSSQKYGVGRRPTAEEIRAWDISIGPTGEELPPGRGTAKEGAQLYVQKGCAGCHGATGTEGRVPNLKSKVNPKVEIWERGRSDHGFPPLYGASGSIWMMVAPCWSPSHRLESAPDF